MSIETQISATKQCEELYPETTAEFKKILKEQLHSDQFYRVIIKCGK